MADFYTTNHEETLIDRILNQGLEKKDLPKYYVLRIAIAKALSLPKSPLNAPLWENKKLGGDRGKEYHLEQITGKGKDEKEDFDVALRALFYVQHKDELDAQKQNIFSDEKCYTDILSKYIKRGLYEIHNSYKNSDCFYQWCLDNLSLESRLANVGIAQNKQAQQKGGDKSHRLVAYFEKFAIPIHIVNEKDSYRHYIIKVELKDSTKIDAFMRHCKHLDTEFGEKVQIQRCMGVSKTFDICIPKDKNLWQYPSERAFAQGLEMIKRGDYKLGIFAGMDRDKKPFCFDLVEAVHCFVGGTNRKWQIDIPSKYHHLFIAKQKHRNYYH
ncbi:hypothetical protein [uncultured Helicobacter sp.]|uniref:hypothetical protein n=1 Tax=uncultured Helicobacter sp. TaxID=175537 RepID=UPI0025D1205B|nr:hypothetical protein [uncultured Helicobacter sp.]